MKSCNLDSPTNQTLPESNSGSEAFAVLSDSICRVSGHDAIRYLQGRISQDITSLKAGDGAPSLMLSPKGKVQAKFVILKHEDFFTLILEETPSELFSDKFLKFKVADDVNVQTLKCISIHFLGNNSTEILQNLLTSSLPENRYCHIQAKYRGEHITVLKQDIGLIPGYKIVLPEILNPELISDAKAKGATCLTTEELELLRIEAGVPLLGQDILESSNLGDFELAEYIAYTKGCYTGQEVVEKLAAYGRSNQKLVKLQSVKTQTIQNCEIQNNAPLKIEGSDGLTVGKITSIGKNLQDNKITCLALVKRSHLDSSIFYLDELKMKIIA